MRILTFSDIKLPITANENELLKIAEKKLGAKAQYFSIKKKSLDARDKGNIKYVYTIECSKEKFKETKEEIERLPVSKKPQKPVLVVGSGPAGLFCALRLLERGIAPIVIERGAPVEERERDTQAFFKGGKLNIESNVQFGEGGAGTFSDGKLNTQTHGVWNKEVLKKFVSFGAPKEIEWLQKPHIGSDNLIKVVKNMREYIINHGGEVRFHTRLKDIKIQNGEIKSVVLQTEKGEEQIEVSSLVLAVGHSARDTFSMLCSRGVPMRQKDFAVGVRIEHLQKDIGFSQYGKAYTLLPPADYKLVSRGENGRSAFTFCMCPGGFVMPATSEEGCVVSNGMSNYARDGKNANSALIAQVTAQDFGSEHALAGVEYQRKIERAAFVFGGNNYCAPVQLVKDFLNGKESSAFGEITPTYARGTTFSDLNGVLPKPVCETLKTAISFMDTKLKGFARQDAVLTAAETRTSSPVRIERDDTTLQSLGVKGLYPCGEGAGYAGGITSSAADGLKIADAIFASLMA